MGISLLGYISPGRILEKEETKASGMEGGRQCRQADAKGHFGEPSCFPQKTKRENGSRREQFTSRISDSKTPPCSHATLPSVRSPFTVSILVVFSEFL